jgi:lipopolysaccharide exporter
MVQSATFIAALPVMLLVVHPWGEAGVAAAQLVVGLAVGVPLYLLSLRSVDVRVGAVARGVVLPTLAGLLVWAVAAALARMVEPAFFAAAGAALVSVAVIAALALTQRANLRLLRTALANRATP